MPRLSDKAFCAHCSMTAPDDYTAGTPFICLNCGEKNNTWLNGVDRTHYRLLMDWCKEDASRTWCISAYDPDGNPPAFLIALVMSNWIAQAALFDPANLAETIPNTIALWRDKYERERKYEERALAKKGQLAEWIKTAGI